MIPTCFENEENQQTRAQGFKPFSRYPKSKSWKCKGWSCQVVTIYGVHQTPDSAKKCKNW